MGPEPITPAIDFNSLRPHWECGVNTVSFQDYRKDREPVHDALLTLITGPAVAVSFEQLRIQRLRDRWQCHYYPFRS